MSSAPHSLSLCRFHAVMLLQCAGGVCAAAALLEDISSARLCTTDFYSAGKHSTVLCRSELTLRFTQMYTIDLLYHMCSTCRCFCVLCRKNELTDSRELANASTETLREIGISNRLHADHIKAAAQQGMREWKLLPALAKMIQTIQMEADPRSLFFFFFTPSEQEPHACRGSTWTEAEVSGVKFVGDGAQLHVTLPAVEQCECWRSIRQMPLSSL